MKTELPKELTDTKLSCCMIRECIYSERKHIIPGGETTFNCAFKYTFINESGKCGRMELGDIDKDYFKIRDELKVLNERVLNYQRNKQ